MNIFILIQRLYIYLYSYTSRNSFFRFLMFSHVFSLSCPLLDKSPSIDASRRCAASTSLELNDVVTGDESPWRSMESWHRIVQHIATKATKMLYEHIICIQLHTQIKKKYVCLYTCKCTAIHLCILFLFL